MSDRPARLRIGITAGLALSFGLLVLAAVVSVLGVVLDTASDTTHKLLRDKAALTLNLIRREVHEHFEHVEAQTKGVARAVAEGATHPEDPRKFTEFLDGALASLPEVHAIEFISLDGHVVRAARHRGKLVVIRTSATKASRLLLRQKERTKAWWGRPVVLKDHHETMMVIHRALTHDGKPIGVLSVYLGTDALAGYLRRVSREVGATGFILEGRDRIVATGGKRASNVKPTAASPLLPLKASPDEVLRHVWHASARHENAGAVQDKTKVRVIEVAGRSYVFVHRQVDGHTGQPWIVGAYIPAASFDAHLDRLFGAGIVGLVALVISLVLAVVIGRQMSRPVIRISDAARQVSEMDLDDVGHLPASRVRELDQQSATMNRMVEALKWFQAYVPKPLVRRLVQDGGIDTALSDRRRLTVMFTDIAGYSTISEGKGAAEIADLLNQHFTIVAGAVEAEVGTVDKFIGDSVMAFWGAPEKQKNRAIRACRAALSIRDGIAADNKLRESRGEPPVRMRIGIHSGEATVGNIGPPDRVNYTVIGDDVNVAQRLEQLGKQVAPDDEVAILISAATVEDLDDSFVTEPAGDLAVKGREAPVEVYRLVDGPRVDGESPTTSA